MPKPLLKWVGGKTKLLNKLNLFVPKKFDNYVEPFVGGGAVLFSISPNKGVISDANRELVNFYRQVRDNPLEVLELALSYSNNEAFYYKIRDTDVEINWRDSKSCLYRASRFLYLNRTSFNGMWRVNAKGKMNIPYGRYDNISWPTKEHFFKISKILKQLSILDVDFYSTLEYINSNTFVYLDPPYIPYSDTANFTKYASADFGVEDQKRLVSYCNELTNIGAKFLLSNSDTALTRELYSSFIIEAVEVYHSVGASAESRREKGEVIIRNYDDDFTGLFIN